MHIIRKLWCKGLSTKVVENARDFGEGMPNSD